MTFQPLGTLLLIKQSPAEEKSKGGIILLNSSRNNDPIAKGVVAAVGTKSESLIEIKVGDNVLFSATAGSEIVVDNVSHIVLDEDYVHVKIQK